MTNDGVVLPHSDCKSIAIVVTLTRCAIMPCASAPLAPRGAYIGGKVHVFENKPPPQSG